jgi:hypothetical protein
VYGSNNCDLIMVVLGSKNNSTDKYSAIKNRTCVKNGIPSQVKFQYSIEYSFIFHPFYFL